MANVLKEIFGKDTDHKRAQMVAQEVATLLVSKGGSNQRKDQANDNISQE
jgi:hypothetical protein